MQLDRTRLLILHAFDPFDPPQDRADPDGQLAQAERLREVVVGADREARDLVGLLGLRRQHQDRGPPVPLDPLADLQTVHAREHEVEHDEIGLMFEVRFDRLRAVERDDDPVALALESGAHRLRDRRLVVDDQHGLLAHRPIVRGRCGGREAG